MAAEVGRRPSLGMDDHRGRHPVALVVLLVSVATQPTPTSTAAPYTPRPMPTPTVGQKIAFLGDSYAAGSGAESRAEGYPSFTARGRLSCARIQTFGEGGTGYSTGGSQGGKPFSSRVRAVISARPDVVVVQGSTNDRNPTTTGVAASKVFEQLRAGLPKAVIVAVGPTAAPLHSPGEFDAVSAAVASAARANGVAFIDPTGWLGPRDYIADRVHPNPQGHEKFGTALAAQLVKVPGVKTCGQA